MSSKKKNQVAKLSEEDYGNYIMALKDERPVKVVVPEGERSKKKKK